VGLAPRAAAARRPSAAVRVAKLPYYVRAGVRLGRALDLRHVAGALRRRDARALVFRDETVLRFADALDLLVATETMLFDVYGLRRLDARAGTIIDVGAGIGDFTVAAARRFPQARIVALEPHPRWYRLLSENLELNGLANVDPHRVAVATAASYELSPDRGSARSSTVVAGPRGVVQVEGRCLADFVGAEDVALVKIDCEGAELDVLASMSGAAPGRVRRIALEYHDTGSIRRDHAVVSLLRAAGFECRVRPDPYDRALGYVLATRAGAATRPPSQC
jgi:FkbM family methyltransferase